MSKIDISVLVPIYNVESHMARCAASLFSQNVSASVEYIFVDDGSTDGSIAALQSEIEKHPEVASVIIRHKRNKGLAAARRTAILAARGEYVTHVDSDDEVTPEHLASLYAAALTTGADITSGGYIWDNGKRKKYFHPKPGLTDDAGINALKNEFWSLFGRLIRRELYTSHPDVICPDSISYGEDLFSTPRLLHYAEKTANLPTHTYIYYSSNTGSITNTRSDRRIDDHVAVWSSLYDFFASAYPDGRYNADLGLFVADQKASLTLNFRISMTAIKRHADTLRAECAPFISALSPAKRAMVTLLHHHAWPLVKALTLCSALRWKLAAWVETIMVARHRYTV